MKSDTSIKNISVAAVRRHTIKPIDFSMTTLFDNDQSRSPIDQITLSEGELPIAQTLITHANWTLVTTRRIISCLDGKVQETDPAKVKSWLWGNFKGFKDTKMTLGELTLEDGSMLNVHIESGKASMVIIYSIMTLIGQLGK